MDMRYKTILKDMPLLRNFLSRSFNRDKLHIVFGIVFLFFFFSGVGWFCSGYFSGRGTIILNVQAEEPKRDPVFMLTPLSKLRLSHMWSELD